MIVWWCKCSWSMVESVAGSGFDSFETILQAVLSGQGPSSSSMLHVLQQHCTGQIGHNTWLVPLVSLDALIKVGVCACVVSFRLCLLRTVLLWIVHCTLCTVYCVGVDCVLCYCGLHCNTVCCVLCWR
jgi:hypothetical protein